MGYEESKNHLLSLSYPELQCLCKRYNLPAKKTHSQLASSLASMLEASPSIAAPPVQLANMEEASACNLVNNKRGPYSGRDDGIPPVHAKHKKGNQTSVDETSKKGIGTGTSITPVSMNHGRPDCHGHPSSDLGTADNLQSRSDVGVATKTTNLEFVGKHHCSPANIIDQICPPIIKKYPSNGNGQASTPFAHMNDNTDKGCRLSDKISANTTPVQFSVMSDEGIDLVVDLNSSPATWAKNFMAEMRITPPSEHGNFSSFISSLATKDDHSTAAPSGNIIVDIQNKGPENIVPSTDSSLASDVGENSRSVPYPVDTTTVNSVSSTSTVAGTPVELSGYQEGAPVVSSSCLTADVQNNVTSDMPGALDNEVLPPEPVDVFMESERITAPAVCASVQPIGNKCTMSPGDGVRSDSNEDSCPKSSGKQTGDVPTRDQPAHNGGTHETLMENEPVKAVAVEENIGRDDSLSISCQLASKTVAKLPVTDAQLPASFAGHFIAGNFDHTRPTSSAASDNAINSLTSKFGAESAQSHDSTDKKGQNDAEELEELESMTPPAYSEPPRNIQLSLRSASAKVKPSTLPRRSARLLPK
ncbi:endochitinase A-like isoform X2 [Miscanthus floridulus]|uniref:endochitinase A-like isoform X2 n=1 Tax=Miscanthus floridulus TaxID=154761 RepID=UPI003457F3BE